MLGSGSPDCMRSPDQAWSRSRLRRAAAKRSPDFSRGINLSLRKGDPRAADGFFVVGGRSLQAGPARLEMSLKVGMRINAVPSAPVDSWVNGVDGDEQRFANWLP